MSTARIFQRPKNAMQSGKHRTDRWQLEFEPGEAKRPDPLTGWAGSGDTRDQIRLSFPTCEAAIAYAEREGLAYTVIPAPAKTLKLQSYADNFR
ncbi:MAG: ETC complex I subunit [Sphingomonas adhaesiva]|uniref:ETC complex I subunit n=1 Tax=Sphingomonas adhaesiva TaxID=28212 RepID=UPI002FF87BB9